MFERSMLVGVVAGGMIALSACGGEGGGSTASSTGGSSSDTSSGSTGGPPTTGGLTTGTSGSESTGVPTSTETGETASTDSGSTTSDTTGEPIFDVQPGEVQEIVVDIGAQTPTVMYFATFDGQPVDAAWAVDRSEIGAVDEGPAASTLFLPTGMVGGAVTVSAELDMESVSRSIFVKLGGEQNGYDPNNPTDQPQVAELPGELLDAGGIGGVGGEGLGPAVVDMGTLEALGNPVGDGSAENLRFLYPYDDTVWPRGLPAPLLMWGSTLGDVDAIQIELTTTTGSLTWKGTFARPEILAQTNGPFVRHPIPQSIWNIATNTAGGSDKLTVALTVAKDGSAYGPISQTWTIAGARLAGSIHYTSYGHGPVENLAGAVGGNGMFGGAVLSVHVGEMSSGITAGASGNASQCRACHSAAADGSRLIAQRGDNTSISALYDLTPADAVESALAVGAVYPGIDRAGSMALAPNTVLHPLPDNAVPLPASGLTDYVTSIGTSAFALDGTRVVFNPMAGAGFMNPKQKLVVMGFDAATLTFSAPVVVVDYSGQPAVERPGWPSFLPGGSSVVYHSQLEAGADGNNLGDLATRKGARAFLAWTGADAANATPLGRLNGKDASDVSYLPVLEQPVVMSCTGDNVQVGHLDPTHADDTNYNYTPTVNPIASGGYAWVVFTSRRLYGNVATIPPYCSDPRGVDLFENITTKKLWVAAIDLDAQPGADASHPAFYLPGQQLRGTNSHGVWTRDPCKPAGGACSAGVECCGGYCQPEVDDGPSVCLDMLPDGQCAQVAEKCAAAEDCCGPMNACVAGFCTVSAPG